MSRWVARGSCDLWRHVQGRLWPYGQQHVHVSCAIALLVFLTPQLIAQGSGNTVNDVEDTGFDEMENEAANAAFEADTGIKGDMMNMNTAPSALDNEFRNNAAADDLPIDDKGSEAKTNAAANQTAPQAVPQVEAAVAPTSSPIAPPAAVSVSSPAPTQAPAVAPPAPRQTGKASWQGAPAAASSSALPSVPAANVPQINQAAPAVEPAPVAPVASTPPAPNATPVASTPPAPAATSSPTAEGGDETVMTNPVSPEPDMGPMPTEALLANEFAGAPPFPGARRVMADGEAPEAYDVETGDTLYDVCDQLIDDPAYWPKLWALNPEIANPHFIYPGMQLRFYPGDKDTPPFLQVVSEDDLVPVDKEALSEKQLVHDDVSDLLWKPRFVTDEQGNKDEGSAPDVIGPNDLAGIDVSQDFEAWGDVFKPTTYLLTVPAFVYAEEPQSLGVIRSGAAGELLMGPDADVVVEVENGDLAIGTTYSVLRRGGDIERPSDDEFVGYRYDFVGNVTIQHKVDNSFVGSVKDQRLGFEPGDVLVPYVSTSRRIPIAGASPSGGSGNEIIGFDYNRGGIGGRGSYVLFDRSAGEMSVGQTVLVYQSLRRFQNSFLEQELPNMKKAVAKVRIIDTSSKAIVGYVEEDFHEIYIGDRAGAGAS